MNEIRAENPARYSLSFTVRSSEAGPEGRVKLASFLDYFQEAAGEHAGRLGVAVTDLVRRNLTWVISRYHVKVLRFPIWGETVNLTTWPSGGRNLFALREFELADGQGLLLAAATSSWMLIDLQAKKPVPPFERLGDFPQDPRRAIADDFLPLPTVSRTDSEVEFQVRSDDLDWNRHANHVVYITWAIEAAPASILTALRPKEIEVDYRGEALYRDRVISRVQVGRPEGGPELIHQIINPHGQKELARLRTVWAR